MPEPMTKGVALVHFHEFVHERHGEAGFQRLLAALPETLQARMRVPNATEWYPLVGHAETLKVYADLFLAGDYAKTGEIGVHNLRKSVTGVYRMIVRLLEPEYLVRKSARLWSSFVDTGALEVTSVAERRLRIRLVGIKTPHPAWCHSVGGSFEGALLACNAKEPKAAHDVCAAAGGPECSFDVRWS